VRRLSLLPGDIVLWPGSGPIGLMFTRLLRLEGMRVFATDLIESRLKLARGFGAHWVMRGDDRDLSSTVQSVTRGTVSMPRHRCSLG